MPPPTTPHDKLFRALLDDPGNAATLVREVLPPDIAARLAETPPRLVDGTFVDEVLAGTQSDRLFEVDTRDGRPALLYVLLEHKSRPDPRTPLQVLGYMVRIWNRYAGTDAAKLKRLPPIIPVVIYHGGPAWSVPTSVVDCLDADEELLGHLRDMRYVLKDLGPVDYEALSRAPTLRAALGALKFANVSVSMDVIEQLLRDVPDGGSFELQFVYYISQVYDASPAELAEAFARAKPYREDNPVPTAAQTWLKEGEAKGRVEGRIEDTLLALQTRFGAVPEDLAAAIRKAEPQQLEGIFRKALTASSLDEVVCDVTLH